MRKAIHSTAPEPHNRNQTDGSIMIEAPPLLKITHNFSRPTVDQIEGF